MSRSPRLRGRRVHIPKIGVSASVLDEAPLYCGRPREAGTLTTIFAHLATCSRCKRLNAEAVEDLEHARTQARLRHERGEEARP